MQHQADQNDGQSYCFILIPSFSLVAFACAVGALRSANVELDRDFYSWNCASWDGGEVLSSSHIPIATQPISDLPKPSIVVVCGGDQSHNYNNPNLVNWLRTSSRNQVRIGAVSDGSYIIAEAGLFDGHRSTIHWKCLDSYRERFMDLDIRPSIMEIDRDRFSCAGGTASLDLILQLILDDHDPVLVGKIADNYFHDTIRDTSKSQNLTNAYRLAGRSTPLTNALLAMEQKLEEPITIAEIADHVGVSQRQLDRLFKRYLESSPKKHFRDMRLNRASGLLLQTGMKVTEIAIACGFHSASHLTKSFKQRYGTTPAEYRRNAKLTD